MEPINYLAQVADPFAASLKGYASVDAILNADAKRAELARQQQLQQQQQQLAAQEQARFFSNPKPTMRDAARYASLLTPEQANAFRPFMEGISKEQQQGTLKSTGQLLSALQTNPQVFITQANEKALAARNSGDEDDATLFEQMAEAAADPQRGPAIVFKSLAARTAGIPGAKEMFETIDKSLSTARAEAEAPAELRQKLAAANTAEAEAKVKMETATDDIAKAKATREFEQAKARKEQIQADTELETRLQAIGLQKAQINKFKVETRNLDTQGKMLSLDFQAALNGLPLPSKKTEGGGGAATEDERKAAGWLAQATNAYNNMLGAMYTKEGKTTGAEKPGFIESALGTLPFIGEGSAALARGTDRQKFTQAASSLSEALLRAATGAGVNRDEAKQKLEELTPLFTDDADTRKQKLAAIPVYLDSLKSRAGRAAPSGYQVPQAPTNALSITLPDGTVFTAPNQKALDEFKRRAGL
jgi:hypothetical protein